MAALTLFICNDMEESWYAYLNDQSEREQLAVERDEDIEAEARLGFVALLDAEDDGCDPDDYLPEYAPRPYEVQKPEVFEL